MEDFKEMSWQAPEYEHRDKDNDWFWTVGFVSILVAIFAIYFGDWTFGIFAIVAGATLIIFGLRRPEMIDISITGKGIKAKNEFFPFDSVKSFWICNDEKYKELSIEIDRTFFPHITLHFGSADPEEVKKVLLAKVPELFHQKTFSDTLFERFGF